MLCWLYLRASSFWWYICFTRGEFILVYFFIKYIETQLWFDAQWAVRTMFWQDLWYVQVYIAIRMSTPGLCTDSACSSSFWCVLFISRCRNSSLSSIGVGLCAHYTSSIAKMICLFEMQQPSRSGRESHVYITYWNHLLLCWHFSLQLEFFADFSAIDACISFAS